MRRTLVRAAFVAALFSAAGLGAAYAAAPVTVGSTSKGPTLVDAKGMTLYESSKDSAGKSACTGGCATNWPPVVAAAADTGSGDYSIITRDDGSKQWAYKDKPLYVWSKDKKAGDITGDGLAKGTWGVAQP